MPSFYPANPTASPQLLLRSAACRTDQPFADVCTQTDLEQLIQHHHVCFGTGPDAVYNPIVTLWAFLSQCLDTAKDCAAAVTRVVALRVAFGLPLCSHATGGYCRARAKLPVPLVRDLTYLRGDRLEDYAPAVWRWKGRRCLLADGTTLSAPDTAANQAAYPQSTSQKPGLGFPLIRLVVLLGLATAAVVGAEVSAWQGPNNGESSLLRRLYERLRPSDVLLLDAGFCSFWSACLQCQRGVDVVMRLQQESWSKAAQGQKLGPGDYLVTWRKPDKCPKWMDKETYRSWPESLSLREVHTTVSQRGFRTQQVIVITTWVDAERYTADEIGELYRQRWHVELDIRAIKTWLRMEVVAGKTPDMVRREIWGHLLVYGLVRRLQAEAAWQRGCPPRQLSFTQARKQLAENWQALAWCDDLEHGRLVAACRQGAAAEAVGNRPDRYEPRRVKRRPKDAKLLTQPRAQARAAVVAGKESRETKKRRGAAARGQGKPPTGQG